MKFNKNLIFFVLLLIISACKSNTKTGTESSQEEVKLVPTPSFNADSAYLFIEKQVKFGPRIPNTTAHIKQAIIWWRHSSNSVVK